MTVSNWSWCCTCIGRSTWPNRCPERPLSDRYTSTALQQAGLDHGGRRGDLVGDQIAAAVHGVGPRQFVDAEGPPDDRWAARSRWPCRCRCRRRRPASQSGVLHGIPARGHRHGTSRRCGRADARVVGATDSYYCTGHSTLHLFSQRLSGKSRMRSRSASKTVLSGSKRRQARWACITARSSPTTTPPPHGRRGTSSRSTRSWSDPATHPTTACPP